MNPNYKRKIVREVIQSKALKDEKEVLISFPPGYHPNQLYPVLLLHDGDDYFRMGRIVTQANPIIDQGLLRPFLIIGVPVDKKKRNQEYSPAGDRHHQHLFFIIEELIPAIQQKYPADFSPEQWVIGGSSLGGTVSLHAALSYPNHCQNVLMQSGAFLDQTFQLLKQRKTLKFLQVYQSIGLDETSVPTHIGQLDFLALNRKAYRLFVEKEATVNYVEAKGDHTWRFWQKDLLQALHYFFQP